MNEATPGAFVVHVPPNKLEVILDTSPTSILVALGVKTTELVGMIVTVAVFGVLEQEPAPVKVIVAVPAETPVTSPVVELIVATLVGIILQTPDASTGFVEKSEVPEIHKVL